MALISKIWYGCYQMDLSYEREVIYITPNFPLLHLKQDCDFAWLRTSTTKFERGNIMCFVWYQNISTAVSIECNSGRSNHLYTTYFHHLLPCTASRVFQRDLTIRPLDEMLLSVTGGWELSLWMAVDDDLPFEPLERPPSLFSPSSSSNDSSSPSCV